MADVLKTLGTKTKQLGQRLVASSPAVAPGLAAGKIGGAAKQMMLNIARKRAARPKKKVAQKLSGIGTSSTGDSGVGGP